VRHKAAEGLTLTLHIWLT